MTVGPDDPGIDLDQPVDVTARIRVGLGLLQGQGGHPIDRVAAEPCADRLPDP